MNTLTKRKVSAIVTGLLLVGGLTVAPASPAMAGQDAPASGGRTAELDTVERRCHGLRMGAGREG